MTCFGHTSAWIATIYSLPMLHRAGPGGELMHARQYHTPLYGSMLTKVLTARQHQEEPHKERDDGVELIELYKEYPGGR